MKFSKLLPAVLISSTFMVALPSVEASSFGRSSSSSSSGSRSSSSSSKSSSAPSRPSAPAAAPAPSRPGGIGSTSGSMGVRKSEVTSPVAQKVEQGRPSTTNPSPGNSGGSGPTYGSANQPNYGQPPVVMQGNSGPGFGTIFGGALAGSVVGNMINGGGSHGGGTTVINNGTPGGGGAVSSNVAGSGPAGGFDNGPGGSSFSQPKKEYTVWSFIADVFGFVIVIALLLGVAWLFYKGFKMVNVYVKRERGVGPSQPFNPTQKFWEIQKAFAAADVDKLTVLLGPDLVDEATANIAPNTITLSKVSHEVVLSNPREFSIHYTFEDNGEKVDQVFHYELHEGAWKLNGIETV